MTPSCSPDTWYDGPLPDIAAIARQIPPDSGPWRACPVPGHPGTYLVVRLDPHAQDTVRAVVTHGQHFSWHRNLGLAALAMVAAYLAYRITLARRNRA